MMSPLPRSVLVVDDRTYWRIAADASSVDLLADAEAMIVPYSATPEVNSGEVARVRDLVQASGQLSTGALLIKNPYDDSGYELADFAIEAFASAKYHALANVARLLGATSVAFLEARVEQANSKWVADIKAAVKLGSGDAEASREVKKKVEDSLEGRIEFPGGDPDIDAAVAYLGRRRLASDQQLASLVDMRSGDNSMNSYKMLINGAKEADANFRSAVNLANSGPVKMLGVGASFTRTVRMVSRIEIKIEITF